MSIAYNYTLESSNGRDKIREKEVKGVLSVMEKELLFEFKVYDLAGSSISGLNKFIIDASQIKRVNFKRGLFQSRLILESRHAAYLEPLPGSEKGVVKLNISRADRDEAQHFSSKMNEILGDLNKSG